MLRWKYNSNKSVVITKSIDPVLCPYFTYKTTRKTSYLLFFLFLNNSIGHFLHKQASLRNVNVFGLDAQPVSHALPPWKTGSRFLTTMYKMAGYPYIKSHWLTKRSMLKDISIWNMSYSFSNSGPSLIYISCLSLWHYE